METKMAVLYPIQNNRTKEELVADIQKMRKEELEANWNKRKKESIFKKMFTNSLPKYKKKEAEINAKYDAELEAIGEPVKSELTQTGRKKDDTEIKRRMDDGLPIILIDGKLVEKEDAHKMIDDPEFVKGVSKGTINVEQLNDDEFSIKLLAKIREYARSKPDKPLDDTRTEKPVGETKTGISEVIGTAPGSDEKKQ